MGRFIDVSRTTMEFGGGHQIQEPTEPHVSHIYYLPTFTPMTTEPEIEKL